jgi:hypothetical protein
MMLRIDFSNPGIKKASMAVLFYAGFLLMSFLLDKAGPPEPCAPGLGELLIFLLPLVSAAFLIFNAIKFYTGKKQNKIPTIIHGIALIIFLIIFYINIYT